MEYYKDSVEASRNRLTAALEKLVSGQGIEKVLIGINNTLTDLINNIKTVVIIGGTLIALINRQKITSALLNGGSKFISGYMGISNNVTNMLHPNSPSLWFNNTKERVKNSFETAQMDQFDLSLQKITNSLKTTDAQIYKLGEDALTSGQLIVRGLGIEANKKLGSMSVDSRLNAVNLAFYLLVKLDVSVTKLPFLSIRFSSSDAFLNSPYLWQSLNIFSVSSIEISFNEA